LSLTCANTPVADRVKAAAAAPAMTDAFMLVFSFPWLLF
jgi:hypothetical protein